MNELVSFPFSAARGECHPQSLQLAGPSGPLAVQLSEIDWWPNGEGVRSAMLSFLVADLPALGRQTYSLQYGPTPVAPAQTSDLAIAPSRDVVELSTTQFAIRLLHGEQRFDRPLGPAEVPGPVAAMRLSDGTWFGGSQLYGRHPVDRQLCRPSGGSRPGLRPRLATLRI